MKNKNFTIALQVKKSYKKPKLIKHGKVSKLTLKAGSMLDMTTMTNNFQG